MPNELKPCPFCGESNTLFVADQNELEQTDDPVKNPYFTVVCSVNELETETPNWKAGCGASGGYRPTKEEAISAWNSRTKEGT
jgi:Lar family restriction alleviation protein